MQQAPRMPQENEIPMLTCMLVPCRGWEAKKENQKIPNAVIQQTQAAKLAIAAGHQFDASPMPIG